MRLHGTLGPAATTVAGIAAEAGVTRVTVYRHFPDDDALFAACSAHWRSQQTPPDPDAWALTSEPDERLRLGLADIYRFYRDGAEMLTRVHRDKAVLPADIRRGLDGQQRRFREVLLEPFGEAGAARPLRAVVGHAVSFWTWRSLCVEHRLSNEDAVEAMTALVLATARRG